MTELDLFAPPPQPRLSERIRAADPDAIVIEVAGDPVGKGRARFDPRSKRSYTPAKTRNYESTLALAAQDAMDGRPPIEGPVEMEIEARFAIPASWPKKARAAALSGLVYAPRTPDASNLAKAAEDALNAIVYRDDRQIVVARVAKVYSERPGITIRVTPIGAAA